MEEKRKINTRLTLEVEDNRYIWESPYIDEDIYSLLEAFYGLLVTATFPPAVVVGSMKDFVAENKDVLRKRKTKTTIK